MMIVAYIAMCGFTIGWTSRSILAILRSEER